MKTTGKLFQPKDGISSFFHALSKHTGKFETAPARSIVDHSRIIQINDFHLKFRLYLRDKSRKIKNGFVS